MDITSLKARFKSIDPQVADIALAAGLAVAVCLQIHFITHLPRPEMQLPPNARFFVRMRQEPGLLPYILATGAFLPLAFRRSVPWLALLLSGLAAAAYNIQHLPPAFTVLGPMIALYSLAAFAKRRNTGLVALLVAGMLVTVPIFAFSSSIRWVAETTGTFAMLTAAALLGDTARNRREYIAEVEKRALDAEKSREEEALRRVEEERVRIARDVHDIVAHSLSIVTVQAAAAEAVLDSNPAQARESIRCIRSTGKQALGELRSMLDVLRTGDGEVPLAPAADLTHLEQLVRPVREAGLEVNVSTDGSIESIPAYASVSAYRIVQEALTNVVRHSQATGVSVGVRATNQELSLLVVDNGQGAPAEQMARGGHGIRGMRERVEALGGTFSASSSSHGGGFSVSASIPLTRSNS